MPEIRTLIPRVHALEYDGTNADECGSFYYKATRVNIVNAPDELWIKFGPELFNTIVGPFDVGTVFLKSSQTQQQYEPTTWESLSNSYLELALDGSLQEIETDPMS